MKARAAAGSAVLSGMAILGLAGGAVLMSHSGADFAVSALAYDSALGRFPYRDDPWFAIVLHDGAKWASAVAWIGVVAGLAAARTGRFQASHGTVRALGYLAVAGPASVLLVAAARALSAHSCPWDLAQFGGRYEFFPLLGPLAANAGPGRCAPSGHASVGFMWIAAVYARRFAGGPGAARSGLRIAAAVAAWSLLVSATQIARGAHFVSHVLLTAALCWGAAWSLSWAATVLFSARASSGTAPSPRPRHR